jgi:RPN1 N-terminal domain
VCSFQRNVVVLRYCMLLSVADAALCLILYIATLQQEPDVSDLMVLVDEIVPFHLQHNAEAEAVDLLVEVQQLPKLLKLPYIDEKNYERVCLYLIRLADYMVRAASIATSSVCYLIQAFV